MHVPIHIRKLNRYIYLAGWYIKSKIDVVTNHVIYYMSCNVEKRHKITHQRNATYICWCRKKITMQVNGEKHHILPGKKATCWYCSPASAEKRNVLWKMESNTIRVKYKCLYWKSLYNHSVHHQLFGQKKPVTYTHYFEEKKAIKTV